MLKNRPRSLIFLFIYVLYFRKIIGYFKIENEVFFLMFSSEKKVENDFS
jgi:hypothetical protein